MNTVNNKVFVYWNLHKKCWSVRDQKTRKVIQHLDQIALTDCHFKVSEAGRQRVIRERRKNVHAGVEGYLAPWITALDGGRKARYNPYETETFEVEGQPLLHSAYAWLSNTRQVFVL
jgi:hypothetical protein